MVSTSYLKSLALLSCCLGLLGCEGSDIRLGREALIARDYDKALSLFSIAAERDRTNGSVRALLALTYARKGNLPQAIQSANQAARLGSASETSTLFADDARSLVSKDPALALTMYGIAVEQNSSISKAIAAQIADAASTGINNSPEQAIDLYDAALRYDPSLSSSAAEVLSAAASRLIDNDQSTAVLLFHSATQYDPNVSAAAAEKIANKALREFDIDANNAINLGDLATDYDPQLRPKMGRAAKEKAIQFLQTDKIENAHILIDFAIKSEPAAAIEFSKAALAHASDISTEATKSTVVVALARVVQSLKAKQSNNEWAALLIKTIESGEKRFSSTIEAMLLVTQFDPNRNGEIARLCATYARDSIGRGDLENAKSFYNSAVGFSPAIKSTVRDELWDEFSNFLFSAKQLSRISFQAFFALAGSFGAPPKHATTILPYANALGLYAAGFRARAISALEQIAQGSPASREGRAAASILAPPAPAMTTLSNQPFHLSTWSYGVGQGRGVDIKLISTEVTKDEIKTKFSVRSVNHPDILLFGRENRNGGIGGGSCELLYILDDNGVKYYSRSGGFVGGKQSQLNPCASQINIDPNEEVVLVATFPMISRGATGFQFFSPDPDKAGHQGGWQWNNIQIKVPPLDQLDAVREPVVAVEAPQRGPAQSPKPAQQSSHCFAFNGQQVCN